MSETLAQTEVNHNHEAKSFDVLASVDRYQHDLATFKQIQPETRQQVYNEELTYIAEGINRPLTTEFHLKKENGQLVFFDRGQWRPYLGTLIRGLDAAKQEAQSDPRKNFLAERAADDLMIGYKLQNLQPGEKLSWYAAFPAKEKTLYGDKFLGQFGFQVEREMGFLYQAQSTESGVVLQTQSVDNSDQDAFESAQLLGAAGGSLEDMTASYDEVLERKYEKEFHAGRAADQEISEANAWDTVIKHRDLIEDYFLKGIESLAEQNLSREELERQKKRLTYGVWATLKTRLDSDAWGAMQSSGGYSVSVQQEVNDAYSSAASRGEVLFGCGGAITGEDAVLSANPQDIHNMVFNSDKKWMNCPYCGARQFGDPCAAVLYCGKCEAKVVDGKVKSYGNAYKRATKGIIEIAAEEIAKWNRQYELEKAAKEDLAKAA